MGIAHRVQLQLRVLLPPLLPVAARLHLKLQIVQPEQPQSDDQPSVPPVIFTSDPCLVAACQTVTSRHATL